jgi:hypothetical protein
MAENNWGPVLQGLKGTAEKEAVLDGVRRRSASSELARGRQSLVHLRWRDVIV